MTSHNTHQQDCRCESCLLRREAEDHQHYGECDWGKLAALERELSTALDRLRDAEDALREIGEHPQRVFDNCELEYPAIDPYTDETWKFGKMHGIALCAAIANAYFERMTTQHGQDGKVVER